MTSSKKSRFRWKSRWLKGDFEGRQENKKKDRQLEEFTEKKK